MTKNLYRVLTRPNTKRTDIIRAILPPVFQNYHVYATCSSTEQAEELCRLLNIGLDLNVEKPTPDLPEKKKPGRASRAR